MQTQNAIRAAIATFAEDLAVLIKQSVEHDVRVALSTEPVPSSRVPETAIADDEAAWPITGTNSHRVLEILRTNAEGMVFGELMSVVGIDRKPLAKALDKLRSRRRVRREGGRGRQGMRYFASET